MFQALFAHYQEALHIQQLICFIQIVVYTVPPDEEQIVLETCQGC
jgi:hypothetical protein